MHRNSSVAQLVQRLIHADSVRVRIPSWVLYFVRQCICHGFWCLLYICTNHVLRTVCRRHPPWLVCSVHMPWPMHITKADYECTTKTAVGHSPRRCVIYGMCIMCMMCTYRDPAHRRTHDNCMLCTCCYLQQSTWVLHTTHVCV